MTDFPDTRMSLLLRIRDSGDHDAWREFETIYRPVIYRIARKRGYQDADAQDVAQKVMVKIARRVQHFHRDNGSARFSTWLTTVCRNCLIDEFRSASHDAVGGTTNLERLSQLGSDDVSVDDIEREHRRQVFRHAAREVAHQVEADTWRAFWETAVEGRAASQVAVDLEMTVGSVYTARCRVIQRLRAKVTEYE